MPGHGGLRQHLVGIRLRELALQRMAGLDRRRPVEHLLPVGLVARRGGLDQQPGVAGLAVGAGRDELAAWSRRGVRRTRGASRRRCRAGRRTGRGWCTRTRSPGSAGRRRRPPAAARRRPARTPSRSTSRISAHAYRFGSWDATLAVRHRGDEQGRPPAGVDEHDVVAGRPTALGRVARAARRTPCRCRCGRAPIRRCGRPSGSPRRRRRSGTRVVVADPARCRPRRRRRRPCSTGPSARSVSSASSAMSGSPMFTPLATPIARSPGSVARPPARQRTAGDQPGVGAAARRREHDRRRCARPSASNWSSSSTNASAYPSAPVAVLPPIGIEYGRSAVVDQARRSPTRGRSRVRPSGARRRRCSAAARRTTTTAAGCPSAARRRLVARQHEVHLEAEHRRRRRRSSGSGSTARRRP